MVFQRVNRTDPEKVFVICYNSWSTAAVTIGQVVQWDLADIDGVGVTRPTARATSAGLTIAGVVASSSIAAGSYGLVQIYGYHPSVRMRSVTGGAPAVVAGRPLITPVAGGAWCAESVSTATNAALVFPFGFAYEATSGWTTATKKAFIKAMG